MTKNTMTASDREEAMKAEAVRARIAQFCDWFEVQPPKLKTRMGKVYLTDELAAWLDDTGASYDWIFLGDAKGMSAAYRNYHIGTRETLKAVQGFDAVEKQALITALRLVVAKQVPIEEALAAFKVAVEEHRASKVAA